MCLCVWVYVEVRGCWVFFFNVFYIIYEVEFFISLVSLVIKFVLRIVCFLSRGIMDGLLYLFGI